MVIGACHDGVVRLENVPVVRARALVKALRSVRGGDVIVCVAEGMVAVRSDIERRRHDDDGDDISEM